MLSITEKAAEFTVIREVKGITRCFVMENEASNDTSINLGVEGLNFRGIWDPSIAQDIINLNNITTNDICVVLKTYGVEAARAAIANEIAGVFAVYGINVDNRHLGLIADYMVFLSFVFCNNFFILDIRRWI